MARFRLAAVAAAAVALTGACAAPATAGAAGAPVHTVNAAVRLSQRCTVYIHAEYQTQTINGRGPWGLTRFRTGTTNCGVSQRAAIQHCPGSPCPWAHGNWKSGIGVNSNAQAPANSTLEWFYVEFRSNTTGNCTGHWSWYPVQNTTAASGCP